MRMKGGNEEDTLYLSDLILSVFWGDIRCSGRKRWNYQEERNALQTHPEKNKDYILLWWQNKWWRYLLIPQPGSKWRVFPCQSDFILAAVTPGDLDSVPSGQVVKLQGEAEQEEEKLWPQWTSWLGDTKVVRVKLVTIDT